MSQLAAASLPVCVMGKGSSLEFGNLLLGVYVCVCSQPVRSPLLGGPGWTPGLKPATPNPKQLKSLPQLNQRELWRKPFPQFIRAQRRRDSGHGLTAQPPSFGRKGAREERDLPTEDDTQHPTGSEDHPAPSSQYSTTPVVPGPPAWPPVYSTRYASPASPTGSVSLPQPSHSKTFPSPGWVVL